MAPSSISRGPITDALIVVLEAEGFPVGDNTKPEDPYGWQGEPNSTTSSFIPWLQITAGPGQPMRSQAIGDTALNWSLSYTVFYAGLSRRQTEALADRVRMGLTNLERTSVTTPTGDWRFLKVSTAAIGSTAKVSSTYPDYFTQADTFDAWLTKA